MNIWTVKLLGNFQLENSAEGTKISPTQDEIKLLVYLIYFHQRSHSHEQLADTLWSDLELDQRQQIFRATLTSLQQRLSTADKTVITSQGNQLKLDIRYFSVDLLNIRTLIHQVNHCSEPQQRLNYLKQIVQRDYGTLLSQLEDDWIVAERHRWHTLYVATLHQLVKNCLTLKKLSAATAYAHLAVNTEPHNEQTHVDLIKAYIARGYYTSAQRQYSELKRIFNQELKRSVSTVASELMQKLGLGPTTVPLL